MLYIQEGELNIWNDLSMRQKSDLISLGVKNGITDLTTIKDIYNKYALKDIKAIVLGCTHYPLIKDLITKYFKDIPLIDGSLGVSLECKRQILLHGMEINKGRGKVIIYNSKNG